MQQQKKPEVFSVNVREFARLCSLSERTIWALIRDDKIPSIKIGKRRLVPLEKGYAALESVGAGWTGSSGSPAT